MKTICRQWAAMAHSQDVSAKEECKTAGDKKRFKCRYICAQEDLQ